MTPVAVGLASSGAIVGLIYSGLHVATALALTSLVGVWLIRGDFEVGANLLLLAARDGIATYEFAVIPLFVLMGLLVGVADIGAEAFNAANRLFRRVKGGLGVATVAANAVFAAVTGVSIASAAIFTRLAVPEMLRFGYDRRFAVGIVAGSSILGMLIPPSLLMIIFGIIAEVSIGKLFLAGVVPGILMACIFSAIVVATAHLRPASVGRAVETGGARQPELRSPVLRPLATVGLLVAVVIGGIYGGFFTPTEAGAVGALLALLVALARRRLSRRNTWEVLVETGKITASICLLVIAATVYSRMLAMSGAVALIGEAVAGIGLGFHGTLVVYLAILVVLGCLLDSVSILLITVPIAYPVFIALGADPIWFGIITIIAVEMGLLTPPLGISVFVVKATLEDASITLHDVFMGALPFVLGMAACLGVLIAAPWLVTAIVR